MFPSAARRGGSRAAVARGRHGAPGKARSEPGGCRPGVSRDRHRGDRDRLLAAPDGS